MADTTIDTNQPAEGEVLEENEEEIVDETTEESTEKELRENLVQNAVSFLSHDTVKNTPLVRRIAFLEKKGLTSEEITEALRRVSSTSTVAPKPNNTLNQRKPVVANKSVPLRAPRQPINRTPLPPPLPPPPPPKPLWRTVATTIILTLSAVGGISFFYKLLVSRLFQNSQLQLKNQSNINEISTRLPTEQENLSNRTPNARQNINNNRNMENNANNNNLDNNRKLELDVSELKKTVSELHSTLREIKELRTPLSSPMSSNNMNNMNNNTNAQTPLRSQGSQLRSSSSNNNNSSNHSNSNINNNNNNNNNINNNNTNNPSPSPKSMYQPFATKKASFSDILTRVSNGEEIPGIKEVDDAPSNQSLPPPSQSGSSKPWAQRRNEKKDQYSTKTPTVAPAPYWKSRNDLTKSSPVISTPQAENSNANLSLSDNTIKIEEVDEGESSSGAMKENERARSNNELNVTGASLFESLDQIEKEEIEE